MENNKMKKTLKILIVTLLLTIFTVALASCGKKKVEISIKEDAMPQSVFVLGEELDLSSGVLVVENKKGKKSEIAMDADGVTVTGYDKNTLGEQKITVTYMDKSVELTVTVVERMQVQDYTMDYLVGDTLDLNKGRFKITRNDGSNYTVSFKDTKLTFAGFDSSSAGAKTVTATFKTGSDTYNVSFNVNIHNVEKVTLNPPTKTDYKSHDSGVDVSGGILVLSALDGKIKREVPVTADMIRDFDLSLANETNSPLTQTVNVNYDGKNYSYPIKITYTSVSKFKNNAHLVKDFVWEGEDGDLDITSEVGEKAIELMELYFDMSPAEQSLLTRTEVLNMARAAMMYGYTAWYDDIDQNFHGVFGFDDYGAFEVDCMDRDATYAAIAKLENTERPIYVYYEVLNNMITTFAEEVLYTFTGEDAGEALFSYYSVVDPELFPELIDVFNYMFELEALAAEVGADWKTVGIETYAQEVEAVYNNIVNSEFYSYDYAQFFYYVSMWRADDDMFDFLYHYFYEVKVFDANDADNDSKERVKTIISIGNLRLPSDLEEIFAHVYAAMSQMQYISNYMVSDTSQFFYHYFKACQLSKEILDAPEGENDMLKVLFHGLPLNSMLAMGAESEIYTFSSMITYLQTAEGGYYALCGALLGRQEFEAIMDKYMEIIVKCFDSENNEYEESAQYVEDVKAMLALYLKLTPAQQFNFLGTLNAFYAMSVPPLAFDNTGDSAELVSVFTNMVHEVYMQMFDTQTAKDAYFALMLATELYTQRYTNENWLVDFRAKMDAIATALTAMSTESQKDLETFNTNFKTLYDEYVAILATYPEDSDSTDPLTPDLGEWADEIEELEKAVTYVEIGYNAINAGRQMYNIFFSAFERAQKIYDHILANAGDDVKYHLIHTALYPAGTLGQDPDENTIYWSYDYVLSVYRSIYTNALIAMGAGQNVYDIYQEKLAGFMEKSYDLYWSGDKQKVFDIMKAFRELDNEMQIFFITYFNVDEEFYYYAAIESAFIDIDYSEDVMDAAVELVNVEMFAIIYKFYVSVGATADELAAVVQELNDAYAAFDAIYTDLNTDEKAEFDADFLEMYEFYKAVVEEANAAVNA